MRVEHPLRDLAAALDRDRPQRRQRDRGERRRHAFLLAGLRALVEIFREIALERAADLRAVAADLAQRLLDVLRQELRRQLLVLPGDRLAGTSEQALRPADGQERSAGRDAGRLRRVGPHLRGNVDGRASGSLEPVDLLGEVRAGGYDFRESGIRSRAHSMLSFVVSMVRAGQNRSLSASGSKPPRATEVPIAAIQAIRPAATPIAAPTRGPGAIAVSSPRTTPASAPPKRPPIA